MTEQTMRMQPGGRDVWTADAAASLQGQKFTVRDAVGAPIGAGEVLAAKLADGGALELTCQMPPEAALVWTGTVYEVAHDGTRTIYGADIRGVDNGGREGLLRAEVREGCGCGLDGETRGCIHGRVYGPCGDERCGGVCEYERDCTCDHHKERTP